MAESNVAGAGVGAAAGGGIILSLPSSLITLTILPLVDPTDLLTFRLACRGCFEFVHGGGTDGDDEETRGECDELWRLALVRDFGFNCSVGDGSDNDLHTKSFRHRRNRPQYQPESESGGDSFVRTDELFVASTSFDSWKHWTKLQNQFRSACSRSAEEGASSLPAPRIVGPFFVRAALMWRKIEEWCDMPGNEPVGSSLKARLEPGCAVDLASYLKPFRDGDDRDKPFHLDAMQAIFAFYGGQKTAATPPASEDDLQALFHGLIGGYSAYNNLVVTHLESCRNLIDLLQHHPMRGRSFVPFATSPFHRGRTFTVGRQTGRLYVNLGKDPTGHDIIKCACPDRGQGSSSDSVLLWLEEYASRLAGGVYETGHLIPPNDAPGVDTRGILLYPTERDRTGATSRAITRGVEVVASAVLAPEMNNVAVGMFVYSIRIRLLTPGADGYIPPSERGFETCQLRSRHWKITTFSRADDGEGIVEHVRGDGVVGMYPLLREGGYELQVGPHAADVGPATGSRRVGMFVYQSCTEAMPGTFEGELEFVPGSLARPEGEPFNVRVAPFPLRQGESEFIF